MPPPPGTVAHLFDSLMFHPQFSSHSRKNAPESQSADPGSFRGAYPPSAQCPDERLAEVITENLPNAFVFRVIRRSNGTARCEYVSAGISRLLAVQPIAVRKDPSIIQRYLVSTSFAQLMNAERTCAASLAPLAVEVMTDALAGAHRCLQVHAIPQVLPEGEVQWDGVVTDITDTRHAEERLKKQASGLQDLNRELGGYAEAVANNLLGPLQVIERTLQLIREGQAATVKEQMSESLSEMEAASEWMRSLITDMQHMALISESLVTRKRVDLSEIASEMVTCLTRGEPGREVDFSIASGAIAQGDPGLLRMGMRTLLEHAWSCTREIAYARIEFGFTDFEEKRVFHLKHDGAGFDLGKVPRLGPGESFPKERFPRMDGSLPVIRRIIEQHGGRLWTEHSQDAGTVVHFTI